MPAAKQPIPYLGSDLAAIGFVTHSFLGATNSI